MNRTRTRIRSATAGFSLVEVMVAVVVICVGLLGIAKMQALSLSNTTTSRQRALAALQAASVASAMHSNRQYWANPAVANFSVSIQSSVSSVGTPASNDAALLAQLQTNLTTTPGSLAACIDTASSTTPKCNATQLAAFDLTRWVALHFGVVLEAVSMHAAGTGVVVRVGLQLRKRPRRRSRPACPPSPRCSGWTRWNSRPQGLARYSRFECIAEAILAACIAAGRAGARSWYSTATVPATWRCRAGQRR